MRVKKSHFFNSVFSHWPLSAYSELCEYLESNTMLRCIVFFKKITYSVRVPWGRVKHEDILICQWKNSLRVLKGPDSFLLAWHGFVEVCVQCDKMCVCVCVSISYSSLCQNRRSWTNLWGLRRSSIRTSDTSRLRETGQNTATDVSRYSSHSDSWLVWNRSQCELCVSVVSSEL